MDNSYTINYPFLSIGYSAFVDSMSITGAVVKVRPEKFTRITAVTTNSSSISNLDYNMTEMTVHTFKVSRN